MVFEEVQSEILQSKYNAAVSQLYRLDALWQSAHLNSRAGNLTKWNWDLDAIWRELAQDESPDQLKKFYNIKNVIQKLGFKKVKFTGDLPNSKYIQTIKLNWKIWFRFLCRNLILNIQPTLGTIKITMGYYIKNKDAFNE